MEKHMPATPARFCFRPPTTVASLFHRPPPPLRALVVLAFLLPLALPSAPAAAQVVAGQVLDATTGNAVPLAEVALLDTAGTALHTVLTDHKGYFTLSPAAGRYALRATGLGYDTARTRVFDLEDAEALQVTRQQDIRWRNLHEYYARIERHRRLHIGWIATREDLEPLSAWKVREYVKREIPFSYTPQYLRCAPAVYWDGVYQFDSSFLGGVSIYSIEGIEVYRGFGPADIRFSDPNGCGVILVWSRPLTDARKATVRNVLAAVGGFVTAVFVTHWVFGLPLRIF
jgi:hypothetical protein